MQITRPLGFSVQQCRELLALYEDGINKAPFDLILLESSVLQRFSWDGSEFREKAIGALPFMTSSSVDSQRVMAARKKRYEQIRHLPLTEILNDAEASQPEEAIYVTRDDGGTVSQTVVRVSRDEIQFSVTRRGESQRFDSIPRKSLAVLD